MSIVPFMRLRELLPASGVAKSRPATPRTPCVPNLFRSASALPLSEGCLQFFPPFTELATVTTLFLFLCERRIRLWIILFFFSRQRFQATVVCLPRTVRMDPYCAGRSAPGDLKVAPGSVSRRFRTGSFFFSVRVWQHPFSSAPKAELLQPA